VLVIFLVLLRSKERIFAMEVMIVFHVTTKTNLCQILRICSKRLRSFKDTNGPP
jgi:hypothetical protein